MARIDLNIINRNSLENVWSADGGQLTEGDLDKVQEQRTDNSNALNSLPTPFARFFVAKEAFRRVSEEKRDPLHKQAGFAYRQMVSDILDVYELLFNRTYHENAWEGENVEKLEIVEWDSDENIKAIMNKMPQLGGSINTNYPSDIGEKKLYFVVYSKNGRNILLGCSSPYTGFVTPPDMDKSNIKVGGISTIRLAGAQYNNELHIRRKSGRGEYFRDIKMFDERDADFKNYMYKLFGADDVNKKFRCIQEYIRSFGATNTAIRSDYNIESAPVLTTDHNPLIINGLEIKRSNETDIDHFFTNTIIKVPYRISREHFRAVNYRNDDPKRDYDYLLPFKPEVFSLGENIDADLKINGNSVTAYLRYNGQEYKKEYVKDLATGYGKIFDLKIAKNNFNIGLFPNILSPKEAENNYFKLMVVAADEDRNAPDFNIDKISLSFFNNASQIAEVTPADEAKFGVRPAVVRSRQKEQGEESGTKFYELFGTSFNVIEVNILGNTGLLIPEWQHSKPTTDTYTYAVDLGTSNTFISRCQNNAANVLTPEQFKMDSQMASFMHEIPGNSQFPLIRRIEDSIFDKAKKQIKTEFLPAIIDGESYKFPIRTALCCPHIKKEIYNLFDSHNIAFFYEKFMANAGQDITTDIKWDKDDKLLRIFIRELLLIIKCDILQRNGVLEKTRLVWFSPLSFSAPAKDNIKKSWDKEAQDVLGIAATQINHYSESEAPYYYYDKAGYITDPQAVAVIDIGGGSTDFVYFKDNKPQLASSIHFGCDVLWDDGFIDFDNMRHNGIYKKYSDNKLQFNNRKDLEELNEQFKAVKSAGSKDVINFWLHLGKEGNCNILNLLSADFKPLFVYHFTSILYYMAQMYNVKGLSAPHTIIFSGNGSRYIDNFISSDDKIVKKIINIIFGEAFGGNNEVAIQLPEERKEATCFGGLYRPTNAEEIETFIYQGDYHEDKSVLYDTVENINRNFETLKKALLEKYKVLAELYNKVLQMLMNKQVLDSSSDTGKYIEAAREDMGTPLNRCYLKEIKDNEKYKDQPGIPYNDSVFFLPIIDRIFKMTNL